MDFRIIDSPLFSTLHQIFDTADGGATKSATGLARNYVRDATAMAATPVDVIEYPDSFVFAIDMPGLKSEEIRVEVEDEILLVISGERKRQIEEEKEGAKYLKMERRTGKFLRKFLLPENADTNTVSAVCHDGVLTVTVRKLSPPARKKPRTIEVKIA